MKTKSTSSTKLDIIGTGDRSAQRENIAVTRKHWLQKLGLYSLFAAVPAVLVSHVEGARSDDAKKPEAAVPGQRPRLRERLNRTRSNPALLRRQSEFRLPHQKGSFATVATLAGIDDCPGGTIPGGNYPAAAPFVVTGDTTGANDSVTFLNYYYYYSFDASGPDHVYSFTLTGVGPNPRIEVSTTSGSYKPLVYVLYVGPDGTCPPSATGNRGYAAVMADSRWTSGNTAVLDANQVNYLPLNYPLRLLVDSAHNDSSGSGAYTIRMQDVTIAPAEACFDANPIDCPDFFFRQQYRDFLQREPEASCSPNQCGLDFYVPILKGCGANVDCMRYTRGALSANFFRSPEFQLKGSYVMNLYLISIGQRPVTPSELATKNDPSLNDRPHYAEFITDLQAISTPNDDPALTNTKKDQLATAWLQRAEIQNKYGGLSNADFVQTLLDTGGVTLPNQNQFVTDLNGGTKTRAQVLRAIAESPEVGAKFYQQSFVTMEYFGYLRRDPEDCHNPSNWGGGDPNQCGYIFHNHRFNLGFDPDMVENVIVRGFIESTEYRQRFGP